MNASQSVIQPRPPGQRDTIAIPAQQSLQQPAQSSPYHQSIPRGHVPTQATQQQVVFVAFSKTWHIAKLTLRCFDIAFAASLLGVITYFVRPDSYSDRYSYYFGLAQASAVVPWEIAELATLYVRGGKKGIHCGAHVGLHLVLWMYGAVSILFSSQNIATQRYDWVAETFRPVPTKIVIMNIAIVTLSGLLTMISFVLFVRACVETAQRDRLRPRIVIVPMDARLPDYVADEQPSPSFFVEQKTAFIPAQARLDSDATSPIYPRQSGFHTVRMQSPSQDGRDVPARDN